ncbi:MAG TPA: hypothetical protein VG276_13945 [Actinomycetes bacterium]|nr:hypothetical protein [Actinomycetes bacterium]
MKRSGATTTVAAAVATTAAAAVVATAAAAVAATTAPTATAVAATAVAAVAATATTAVAVAAGRRHSAAAVRPDRHVQHPRLQRPALRQPAIRHPRVLRPWKWRAVVLAVLALATVLGSAAAAAAHPLGKFTINQYSGLRVQPDRVLVDYVVDMAEIPAFQTRQELDVDGGGTVSAAEAAAWRDRECHGIAARLQARLDGQALRFAVTGGTVAFPPGQGGLATLRLECALAAPAGGRAGARTLAYVDGNFAGRVGWREITAVGDGTTLEAADVPARSPSARLTAYPKDLLRSPLAQDQATVRFRPGGPRWGGAAPAAAGRTSRAPMAVDRATAAFAALVARQHLTLGFALFAVLLATVLGAVHALAPGHGKSVMAAYLVGLHGQARQAVTIGATITVTHTAGVLVLGVVLTASRVVAPERLYPWLGLASGLLLAAVGVGLLRRAITGGRYHHHPHGHPHGHGHGAVTRPGQGHRHGAGRGDGHDHRAGSGHDHHHGPEPGHDRHDLGQAHGRGDGRRGGTVPAEEKQRGAWPVSRRALVTLGFAGGLVPSPSAVVVLLGAVALGHAWFGVLLVLAYGVGMAGTLTGIGLLLVRARRTVDGRWAAATPGWLARASGLMPLATASVIVVVGLALAARGAAAI